MSTRENENASTPRSEEGFELAASMSATESALDINAEDFAALEAELAEIDMEEELAALERELDSEETRATFRQLEEELRRLDFSDL